jgi:signal transduction histidine kinase
MRNMADAADRLGTDYNAPQVAVDGPRELRTTAVALNRMQGRISDHVAERTAMIGAIAHDLRTPLARIAFRIESAPPSIREKVQADIQQMQMMISDTIGFVRNVSEHRERLSVGLCELIASLVQKERETGHDVQMEANEAASIVGDPIALSRLFQNLIDNAIGYGQRSRVGIVVQNELVTVTVSDDGPGLEEAQIARMLLPFERGDPSRNRSTGGTGLGLAIAKAIVEDHGGSIALVNRPDKTGLDVRCTFPTVATRAPVRE